MERAVVRRPPRARLLDAVRAAGRVARAGVGRRVGAVGATAAFVPIARSAASSPAVATTATWLFAAGVFSNVVIGRMPFTLGIALAVAAWLCAERPRPAWMVAAATLALACVRRARWPERSWCSRRLRAPWDRWAGRTRARGRARAPVTVGGSTMAGLFPEGGDDRFVATAFWPMLAVAVAAAVLIAPGRRALRIGACSISRPDRSVRDPDAVRAERAAPAGAARPGAARARPRTTAPRLAIAGVLVALLYLQWLPAVRAVAEAHGDPSTEASFFADPRASWRGVVRPGERVEVAFTHNHWEVAHLATAVPLARGWERQLNEKANPLFYDGRPLTPERYHRWLRDPGCAGWRCRGRRSTTPPRVRRAARARRPAVPAASPSHGRLGDLGAARRSAAGLRRRACDRCAAERVRHRRRRPDGRPPALHPLVAVEYRLRERGAGRLDARHARCARPVRVRAGLPAGDGPDCARALAGAK